jgi:hypothetical protein
MDVCESEGVRRSSAKFTGESLQFRTEKREPSTALQTGRREEGQKEASFAKAAPGRRQEARMFIVQDSR